VANVVAIQQFVDDLNVALNALITIREDLAATDRLWPSLNATSKTAIRTQLANDLVTAKAAVNALVVP